MIKPETNDHSHLVYVFTLPLNTHLNTMIFRIFKHNLPNTTPIDFYEKKKISRQVHTSEIHDNLYIQTKSL